MALVKVNIGDKLTASLFNNQTFNLFKGMPGFEDTVTLAANVPNTLLLRPNVAPAASGVNLFAIQQINGTTVFSVDYSGNVFSAGGATFGSLTFTNFTALNGTVTNLSSATATITGLTSNLVTATNLTAGAASVTGQTSLNNLIVTGTATFSTISVTPPVFPTLIQKISPQGTSTVNFTGIPQTYTHLQITYQTAIASPATVDSLMMVFNNDVGANYDLVYATPSQGSVAQNQILLATIPGIANANVPHMTTAGNIMIMGYNQTAMFKAGTATDYETASPVNVAAANLLGFNWHSQNPITQIIMRAQAGGQVLASGSNFCLYGWP